MNLPPQPDRAFFESDPEAAEIRNLTVAGIKACLEVLGGVRTPATDATLLETTSALRERGVVPAMHALDPADPNFREQQRRVMTTPRMAAEMVAGQVLLLFEQGHALEIPSPEAIDQAMATPHLPMPPEVAAYYADYGSLVGALNMLDAVEPPAGA